MSYTNAEGKRRHGSNPFGVFRDCGSFGSHDRRMMPSQHGHGVRDPFDDPFFTRPFGQSASYSSTPQIIEAKGVLEGEVDYDHDGDYHNSSFQNCKVTYGGVNGAYYTSTRNRTAGSDGAVFEESKEADRTTGQAAHRISRGIHDKGHSVTRKLNSNDGKMDTKQTLHNLKEDELNGFEEEWKGNVKLHNHACYGGDERNRLLPSAEHARNFGGTMPYDHKGRMIIIE